MHSNIFNDTVKLLNKLGAESGVSSVVLDCISRPEVLTEVNFSIKMDNGSIKIFKGYRSRYSTLLGTAKGGIRFHHDVTKDEVNSLALWMMVKNALVGLPYGGAKGGVVVDARILSQEELERVSRGYVRAIYDVIGEQIDVPAPDVGTNQMVMSWMVDEYNTINRISSIGTFTGKPIALGGSLFRTEATGYGVSVITNLLSKKIDKDPKNTKIAVQGLGNVGYFLTKFLIDLGYKVVCISDVEGAIFNENGLNIPVIFNNLEKMPMGTSVCDRNISGEEKIITNNELLELDVDILIPAAIENAITTQNANSIKADYIVEAANGPVQADANAILEKNGIIVVPDVLANAGGVVVSYFEWLQNLSCDYWQEEEVKEKLISIMTKAFTKVWDVMESKNISMRSAAYSIALKRLESAYNAKNPSYLTINKVSS